MTAEEPLPGLETLGSETAQSATAAVTRAFGVDNRRRLLSGYFDNVGTVQPNDAWKHVFQLLLWIDRTTGLAHCYESDKCQPGRPWYGRSLRFHDWLSTHLGVVPTALANEIDWLFTQASADLAAAASDSRYTGRALKQRAPYSGQAFPEPGEDPELIAIILESLGEWLHEQPPSEALQALTRRIQAHVTKENKRKNLVGEGFEDTLVAILNRTEPIARTHDIFTRPNLHDLPGFNKPSRGQKPRQVDVALVRRRDSFRTLITAKWSIRSDREEQFPTDFNDYSKLEASGENFAYVLVTNEFDAARLLSACDVRRENALLFNNVVHVNPDAPVTVYGAKPERSAIKMIERAESGRLQSLSSWINSLKET